ncbi:MAG: acyl-CoA dehydrogenase [Gammaproteobacteria bacterium]|nr:acyl-CoA dehydrogenase [Gammaproteobacteria bacterium]
MTRPCGSGCGNATAAIPGSKRHYLPRLATGEEIPCFALTGPEAGSDASAIPDTGVVCRGEWQGREVLGVRIDWDKRYITLAPVASIIGLAFRLRDPDHLLGEREDIGITVALIPRHLPGITIGRRHITLGIPFQNGPISGRGVFVPLEQIIGGRTGAGHGWAMLMECLAEGRGISLPALAVGAAKTASRYTGAYAAVRRQFGTPIGHFEGVEEILARIGGLTYQMDAARLLCLTGLDLGEQPAVISAIVKLHLTEGYRRIINDAMDIQGGSGICPGPGNLFGRAYQAIPIAITVEGANVLTRNMIVFGQGAIRCHPWVLEELEAVHDADKARGLARFDRALAGHVAFLLGNLARTLFLGLGDGRLSAAPPHPATRRHYQHLNRISAAFALCADATMMTLGGTLKRRERLSARLGDVLSELVLASAVLKRFEDDGRPAADLPLVHWCCERGLYRMQEALRAQLGAIPLRPLGWLLRLLVFPTGCHYGPPDDRLDHEVARLLLAPSATRDRLTAGIFTTTDPSLRQGQLERALLQTRRTAPLEKTLRDLQRNGVVTASGPVEQARQARARGFITARECSELERMFRWRAEVVAVDHFEDYGHRWALTADGREPAATAAPHAA